MSDTKIVEIKYLKYSKNKPIKTSVQHYSNVVCVTTALLVVFVVLFKIIM